MKKITLTLLAACLLGCSSTPTTTVQTPAQIVAKVCPPAHVALTSLTGLVGLPADAEANIQKASTLVAAVCADGAVFTNLDLQNIDAQAVPLLMDVAKAVALTTAQQNDITLAIGAVQIAISFVQSVNP
jgi:hypothetical protein